MDPKAMIILMAACDRNNAIGKGNTLPWRHRGDMKRFKEATTGNTVVMGSKTYESMGSKPLPHRLNIVVTRNPSKYEQRDDVFFVTNIEDALAHHVEGHMYVIGGAEIYKQFLPFADMVTLTRLDLQVDGADTFFPEFDQSEDKWDITIVKVKTGDQHPEDVAYDMYLYKRKGRA